MGSDVYELIFYGSALFAIFLDFFLLLSGGLFFFYFWMILMAVLIARIFRTEDIKGSGLGGWGGQWLMAFFMFFLTRGLFEKNFQMLVKTLKLMRFLGK